MKTLMVKADQVSRSFQEGESKINALHAVSCEMEHGAFLALSGPSGSGKTTLLNMIGCLDKPTEGKIYLDGQEVSSLSQNELTGFRLRKIGFIFQDFNLIPTLTAAENIEYVLWLQGVSDGERKRRASEIAERFGIGSFLKRRPWQMSRGQQQRVAVARALVHKPMLVIGDEMTANLDHKTGTQLMEFLKQLNREERMTFVFATHDPLILGYADQVIRMQDGKIIETAKTSVR